MEALLTTYRTRILTPDTPNSVIFMEDGIVEVQFGQIKRVEAFNGQWIDEDLRPGVMTPGFVDTHVHFPQTRIIGSASGPLLDWLDQSVYPEESRFSDVDYAAEVANDFCHKLAASGTTFALIYGSSHLEATNQLFYALERWGLRGVAGPVLMDTRCPLPLQSLASEAIPHLDTLRRQWHGKDKNRLRLAVIPRFALCCSPDLMTQAAQFANDHELLVSTHISENLMECEETTSLFKSKDYLSVYENAGLIHDRSVLAHGVHLSDGEWKRLGKAKAAIAHCPDSNCFLGSGGMNIAKALDNNLRVSVGTDVGAGRSFSIPSSLSYAYDNALRQSVSLSLEQLLWWGTRGGALALHEEAVGQLAVGFEADMACWSVPKWVEGANQVLGWLLFNHHERQPQRTWVRGTIIWDRDKAHHPSPESA